MIIKRCLFIILVVVFYSSCKREVNKRENIRTFYEDIYSKVGLSMIVYDEIMVYEQQDFVSETPGLPFYCKNNLNEVDIEKIIAENLNYPVAKISELNLSGISIIDESGNFIGDTPYEKDSSEFLFCDDSHGFCGPRVRFSGPFFLNDDYLVIQVIGWNNMTNSNDSKVFIMKKENNDWVCTNSNKDIYSFLNKFKMK